MEKTEVVLALEAVADARKKWTEARKEFDAGVERVLKVLLHEAARHYMSPSEIAKALGMARKQVTTKMKAIGLHPNDGKRLLSDKAARALAENAELLGVRPGDIDLMSPLAYLPMGDEMRKALQSEAVQGVKFLETCGCPDPSPGTDDGYGYCSVCRYEIKLSQR